MKNYIVRKAATREAINRAIRTGKCKTPADVEAIAARLGDEVFWPGALPDTKSIEASAFLREMGVPAKLTGYSYLLDAVGKGFAVSEIMWSYDGGHVVVGDIRSRHQKRFFWDTEGAFKVRTDEAPGEQVHPPPLCPRDHGGTASGSKYHEQYPVRRCWELTGHFPVWVSAWVL